MSRKSYSVALGGIISAICVLLEFSVGILPLFLYIFPMICAILINILVEECGMKTAISAYAAVSIVSTLICPDKEAVAMFAGFFGYYPIARVYIERLVGRVLRWIVKLAVFNIAIVLSYLALIWIMGLEQLGLDGAVYMNIILLAVGNAIFIMFDIVLARLLRLYNSRYRGRFFRGRR